MSRIKVSFHLTGRDAEYARAFENHCYQNLGVKATLDEIIRRTFMKFVYDSVVEQSETGIVKESGNGTPLADTAGNTSGDAIRSESTDSTAEAGQTDTTTTGE